MGLHQQLAQMNVRGVNGPIKYPTWRIHQAGSMVASQTHVRTSFRCKAASTVLVDTPRTSAIRPMATDHGVQASIKDGIKHIKLPEDCFEGFGADLEEVAEQHGITLTPDVAEPLQYARYIAVATAYVTRYLPPSLLFDLQTFFLNKDGPSVIYIEGLPMVDHIPPSPESGRECKERLPATEMLLVGLGKCIGDPFSPTFSQVVAYRTPSLAKFMIQASGSLLASGGVPLLMHQDYVQFTKPFVDGFMLLGVRQDAAKEAKTQVCDNRHLVSQLSEADKKLLREGKMYTLMPNKKGAGKRGLAWNVLRGTEDNPEVKLHASFPGKGNDGETPEVLDAFKRCGELAMEVGQQFALKKGDLLLINNRRSTHGRTAYSPPPEPGLARWVARVNLRHPGTVYAGSSRTWPTLVV